MIKKPHDFWNNYFGPLKENEKKFPHEKEGAKSPASSIGVVKSDPNDPKNNSKKGRA